MNDITSLFIATTILAFSGLGLFMLNSNDSEEITEKNSDKLYSDLEENHDDYKIKDNIENDNEWFDFDNEVKKSKNDKTRRNKKKQRASRRRM